MSLLVTGALAAVSLLVALLAVRRERAVVDELEAVRHQLRDVSGRLASVEKSAEEASSRAQAAGHVLLEKGIADADDLEAARRLDALEADVQPVRGSRTLH